MHITEYELILAADQKQSISSAIPSWNWRIHAHAGLHYTNCAIWNKKKQISAI